MKINTDNATTDGTIQFTFDDLEPVTFNCHEVHDDLCIHAMMFGFTNKVKDTAAIKKCEDNHFTITESMRREKVVEMTEHLQGGGVEWNLKTSGRKAPQNTAILALAKALDKTYEEAEAHIAEMAIAELSE